MDSNIGCINKDRGLRETGRGGGGHNTIRTYVANWIVTGNNKIVCKINFNTFISECPVKRHSVETMVDGNRISKKPFYTDNELSTPLARDLSHVIVKKMEDENE